jgi:hypothetical protein
MTTFNRTILREISADIDVALAEVARKHGINLEKGTIRFSADSFKVSVSGSQKTSGSLIDVIKENDTGTDLFPINTRILVKRTVYTITGYNKNAPKYQYNVVTDKGAKWRASHSMLAKGVRI